MSSLFGQATPGGTITSGAGNNGTNGLHFTVSSNATLQGVWHWSSSSDTQLPTSIALYTTQASPTSGTLVTSNSATWLTGPGGSSASAGSGWCFAAFTSPQSITSGTNYMAANFRNDATNRWFSFYTVTWPVTTGIITAPKDESTSALSQGWYNIGTALAMPLTQSGTAGSNFGMDVEITSGNTSTVAMNFNPAMSASVTVANPVTSTAAMSFTPAMSASVRSIGSNVAMSFNPAMSASVQNASPVTSTVAMGFNPGISASVTSLGSNVAMGFTPAVSASVTVANPVTATAAMGFNPGMSANVTIANPVTSTVAMNFLPALASIVHQGNVASVGMSFRPAIAASVANSTTRTPYFMASSTAGTDEYGNAYIAGAQAPAFWLPATTGTPPTPSSGYILYASSTHLLAVDSTGTVHTII